MKFNAYPFLFGTQYYRAPTPASDCWEHDLERICELGMTSIKIWAQWRWSHREPDMFYFEDLDQLMDLAHSKGLAVHINTILDVAPIWFYEKYPDAHPILADGRQLGPFEVASRQIGGHPRPTINHPGARAERQKFFRATVEHFRSHPALEAWDVWNEPDLCGPARTPDPRNLADYNPHNVAAFRAWLREKYEGIEALNAIWGRCYSSFEQAEAPRTGQGFADFCDWRDFHCDLMVDEAQWRYDFVAELDPGRMKFLHVVPSIRMWNPVGSATDDVALTRNADLFASTGAATPWWQPHIAGCADGRSAWNTEVHIAHGRTNVHPRIIGLDTVRRELLPQIGGGIRGFQFWQFRPESLGQESPAWGIIRLDGSDRPLTEALQEFWRKLQPHADRIASCPPAKPLFALWRDRRNEFHHAAMHGNLDKINASYQAWLKAMHWRCIPGRTIDALGLHEGKLDSIKLLIMAEPYFLSHREADAIAEWVASGGVLISEAHLGAYDGTIGRHSGVIPGCGLAEIFGFHESESTAAHHLDLYVKEFLLNGASEEEKQRLLEAVSEAKYFKLNTSTGISLPGTERYAEIFGEGIEPLAWLDPAKPVVISRQVGNGTVFYLGTDVGLAAEVSKNSAGLEWLLDLVLEKAGVSAPGGIRTSAGSTVRVDHLCDEAGNLAFVVAHNASDSEAKVCLNNRANLHGLYDGFAVDAGQEIALPPLSAEFYIVR